MYTKNYRKEYNANGSETTILDVKCDTIAECWDGSISSNGVSVDDAFDIEEITFDGVIGTEQIKFINDVQTIQSQVRTECDDLLGSLTETGYVMQDEDNLSLVPKGETNPVYEEKEITIAGVENVSLANKLGIKKVYVFPADKSISVNNFSGITADCNRDTDVVWAPVSYQWWNSLSNAIKQEIIDTLGLTNYVSLNDTIANVTVDEDGLISEDTELSSTDSRVWMNPSDTFIVRQFQSVDINGGSSVLWSNNPYVVGIIGCVPKVTLESILGLSAVFVGINGGVPEWMVSAVKTYGLTYAQLINAMKQTTYSFLDYLHSSGTQYIDTEVSLTSAYNIETKVAFTSISAFNFIFGQYATSTDMFQAGVRTNKSFAIAYGSKAAGTSLSATEGTYYKITDGANGGFVGNTQVLDAQGKLEQASGSIIIFARRSENGIDCNSIANLKYFSAKGESSSVFFGLPCLRKSDSKPGMYDLVSGTFFTNQGTGDFTYGSEVTLKSKIEELLS